MLRFHAALLQHLLTCEVDGKQLTNLADCVERLKSLEELDRVWGQSMLMEVQGSKLLLKDIETKVTNLMDHWMIRQRKKSGSNGLALSRKRPSWMPTQWPKHDTVPSMVPF